MSEAPTSKQITDAELIEWVQGLISTADMFSRRAEGDEWVEPVYFEAFKQRLERSADETESPLQRFAEWAAGASCHDDYAPRMVKHIAAMAKDALSGNADLRGYPAGIGAVETSELPECQNLNCRATGKCVGTSPCTSVQPPKRPSAENGTGE